MPQRLSHHPWGLEGNTPRPLCNLTVGLCEGPLCEASKARWAPVHDQRAPRTRGRIILALGWLLIT